MIKSPWTTLELDHAEEIGRLSDAFCSGGITADGAKLTISDAINVPGAPVVFKRVITEIIQEAIEPNLIGEKLLTRIGFDGYGAQITFGTLGALGFTSLDMAEGQEYPEFGIQMGGGTVTANIGKSGIALKITDEMIKYSQWDIMAMHLRQAGYALARHKEQKIMNMFNKMGVVTFDNANPTQSELGRTTGRNLTGAGNGSFTMDDLFDMYAKTMERGFTPDTILVHPLAWATFVKDPVMREIALQGGGLGSWFTNMPKNVSPNLPEAWSKPGKTGQGPAQNANATAAERVGTQQSKLQFPSYSPLGNISIIPTPHAPFDPVAKTTSIIMLDSKNVGAIVVAEDPMTEEWDDPARDIKKIKIRERYGLVLFNEGQAVSIAKNVSIEPNEIALPPTATVSGILPIVRK